MFDQISQKIILRVVATMLFVATIAGIWDVWWHGFVGRETLFEPPHILLYLATIFAILAGIYGWYRVRDKVWRRIAIILAIVPLSAPFDEFWHRLYGVEDLSSPFIVWAPPHLALILSVITAFFLLLPLVRREEDIVGQRFFGSMVFAGIISLLLGIAAPFEPLGPYHVIGFYGPSVIIALLLFMLFFVRSWMPGLGSALLVTVMFLLVFAVGFEHGDNPADIIIQPHAHPPAWLIIFSFLLPAIVIDLGRRISKMLLAPLAGILWAGVLYGTAFSFIEPEFQYSQSEMIVMIGAAVGGSIVAAIASILIAQKFGTYGRT